MNGTMIGGRAIKVGRAVSSTGTAMVGDSGPSISSPNGNTALSAATQIASSISQSLGQRKVEDSLSHEENLTISGKDRYLIMQKLARGGDLKVCLQFSLPPPCSLPPFIPPLFFLSHV
jgi:hypothetical protein